MSTLYEDTEFLTAISFMEGVTSKQYLLNPPELKSNKSQQLYNKFIDFVVATNPQRYYQDDFVKLTSDEVEEAFCYTIFRIFGDTEEIRSLVAAFGGKVRVSNDREILSGATVTVLDKRTGGNQTNTRST